MTNKDVFMIGGGSILGLITLAAMSLAKRAIGEATASRKISQDLCDKLDMAYADIQKRTSIEISDKLIDDVVATMAERKLDRVIPGKVQDAVDNIKAEAIKKIHTQISEAVAKEEPEIRNTLEGQVRGVSIDDVRKSVIDKAAKEAKVEALNDIRKETDRQLEEIKGYGKAMKDELDDKVDDIVDELQDRAEDKFDTELETLTTRYKSRLDDVSSIYASLANKIGN